MMKSRILGIAFAGLALAACKKDENKTEATTQSPPAGDTNMATSNGLIINDVKVGDGAQAVNGKEVTVHYTGMLNNKDGKKFDSSVDRGEKFKFVLGQGRVIQGWEQGILNMKVGGKRELTIPPEMGYGGRDLGVIPPNSTLFFTVELFDVK